MINAAYLPVAPIHDDVLTSDNKLEDSWKNHFDAISQTISLVVVHDRFNDTKQETPVTRVIEMKEARRDQLDNARDGTIIYNLDTNKFNFRQGGAWVTFTPIPAQVMI